MVKFIIRFVDLLLYTSLFTACCATGLCMATERLITAASPPLISRLHILVLGSTLLVYNTPRIIRRPDGDHPHSLQYRKWYFFSFTAGMVLTAVGLYRQQLELQLSSVALGIFAFAYFLPLLPFGNKKRLRDFGWLKITVLAGVWTMATSVLPMLYWHKNIGDYPFEILVRLVFIFTLCVIFDIRDMQADMADNINTLPQKVGIRNSYRLINITLVLLVVLSLIQYARYQLAERFAGALLTVVITWLVVGYLRKRPSERAYLLLADGVMLLYAILVLVR